MSLMLKKLHLCTLRKARYRKTQRYTLIFLFLFIGLVRNTTAQPKYEFRAVWVATVSNIDWPSEKYLSADSQRTEFIKLLDVHQRNGMNAIIAQVRPATDAFYPSQYEPWSEWLTGTQGKPPIPYYDPLEFMVVETHKRGMEFHAWMNPYRAEFSIGRSSISPVHITKLHPDWFLQYGSIKIFDPGNKEVQKFVSDIVSDVVARYDIDAIHFDDYFYPYPIAGKEIPDEASFSKYGNGLNKEDWRRSNVDSIILTLSKAIKLENKFCKFGVSPFGVWRNIDKDPQGSDTKGSLANYDDLYADILLWLKNKWIDYVAPQLYWEFSHRTAPFGLLLDWWAKHSYGRHLYIGHGIYRALEGKSIAWKNSLELPNQIKKVRSNPQTLGSIYYSSKIFNRNPNGWNDSLQNNYYKYPAIVPPMPWIDSTKPPTPVFTKEIIGNTKDIILHLSPNRYSGVKQYVFYLSDTIDFANDRIYKILPAQKDMQLNIPFDAVQGWENFYISIRSVSKTNNESENQKVYNLIWSGDRWTLK